MKITLAIVCLGALMAISAAPVAQANLYCDVCVEVADQIKDKGVDIACEAIPGMEEPPMDMICDWILKKAIQEVSKYLLNGYSTETACKQIGLCPHEGNCDCGECASASVGRCLSLPNKCPKAAADVASYKAMWTRANATVPTREVGKADTTFCVDHSCNADKVGCCLTCF